MGVGEVLGSSLLGYIQDNYSNKVTTLACLLMTSIAVLVTMWYIYMYQFSLLIAVIMCVSWGVSNGAVNVFSICILGF